MELIQFVKEYWTQIIFFVGGLIAILKMMRDSNEAVKCSLRNDMLEIWDRCKDKKQITKYQLESFMASADLYFKKKGDGFVHTIYDKVKTFEIID